MSSGALVPAAARAGGRAAPPALGASSEGENPMRRPHLGQPADPGAPGQSRAAMVGRAASSRRNRGWALAPALALFASCLDGHAGIFRPSEREAAGGRAAAGWLASPAAIQGSAMKNYLAAVAVFTLAAGSAGLAA